MDVSDMTPIARLALGASGDGDTGAMTAQPMQTDTHTHTHTHITCIHNLILISKLTIDVGLPFHPVLFVIIFIILGYPKSVKS